MSQDAAKDISVDAAVVAVLLKLFDIIVLKEKEEQDVFCGLSPGWICEMNLTILKKFNLIYRVKNPQDFDHAQFFSAALVQTVPTLNETILKVVIKQTYIYCLISAAAIKSA